MSSSTTSSPDGRHLAFPFAIGQDGRTKTPATRADHIRDELVQLVLTNLGERLNLPTFGGDVRRLVFENIDEATQGVAKARLTQAISDWLGHRTTLENLQVDFRDSTLTVEITHRLTGEADSRVVRFQCSSI